LTVISFYVILKVEIRFTLVFTPKITYEITPNKRAYCGNNKLFFLST